MKTLAQFITIVALFFGTWFLLNKVDWIHLLKVEQISNKTEEKLGKILWDFIKQTEKEKKEKSIQEPVQKLLHHLCENNYIDKKSIKLNIIDKDEINAFALPDRRMVIYTGLINACENEEELLAVMGHELAHIQLNHVMQKLMKEIGLGILIGITGQNQNIATIKEVTKVLSSTAFDRNLEREADFTAVDYLVNASVDPKPFADFMFKISLKEPGLLKQLSWMSTHPASEERAEQILEYIDTLDTEAVPVLGEESWLELKAAVKK
ncbi:MAG TPA: M48 family metallopeptidase [Cyclobacteriaceae bacterium]|nr:M48 family metallopeptidase [Cyclobacteriaceae bacterium]